MDKGKALEKVLMALGFIVGGIGMARTFGDLPGDMRRLKELNSKDDQKSDEKAE